MKVARFSKGGDPAFGILDEESDELIVLRGDPMFAGYDTTGERVSLGEVRLLAPVIPRSKVIGIGLNYPEQRDELAQDGAGDHPLMFLKPNTSVVGPGDYIQLPPVQGQIVHEGTLAIVIGRIAKQVPEDRVEDVIFGYTIANDVSARDQMLADGQWDRGKGYDTFCPLGPVIETDADVRDLNIRTFVDGDLRRSGNTGDMIFGIPQIISYVSDVFTLLPGDVILTGTPAGSGDFEAGQMVDITIDGIGTLSNPVRDRD